MIEAYLDESGTDDKSPFVSVAAYGGHHDEWATFSDEWLPVLRCGGMEYFHASESTCDPFWPLLPAALSWRKLPAIAREFRERTPKPASAVPCSTS